MEINTPGPLVGRAAPNDPDLLPAPDGRRRSRTRDSRLAGLVRRHPLVTFFLWFFTVGQALAFAPVLAHARDVDVPTQPFIVASTLIGLLLPALLITRLVDGPDAVRRLWRSALDVRVAWGWYALALLAVPLLSFAVTAAVAGLPPRLTPSTLATALVSGLMLQLILTFIPNNLWEEVAWMGFVQARLQERRGPAVAAVLTGVLFALQHISLMVGGSAIEAVILLVLLAALAIPFRFLTGWVFNRTESLFLVGLLHAAGNAVAGGSGFGAGMLARLYPDRQIALMAHLLTFAVLGLGVVVVTRRRLGQGGGRSSPDRPRGQRACDGGSQSEAGRAVRGSGPVPPGPAPGPPRR